MVKLTDFVIKKTIKNMEHCHFIMIKLACKDYGFDCEFESEGEVDDVITKFGAHTLDEHGIEYSKEALMQFILRKS